MFNTIYKDYKPELIFALVTGCIAVLLNLQFLDAANINHVIAGHDEYIAVKEVYSILHPVSFKHFLMAVISGNALYYGRIMFYLDALFSYLPFKILGVSGMVLSIRLIHSFAIITALIVLANTFLQRRLQKSLFYIGSFALYYSLYFVMMPKPEPWQLLFLALFLKNFKSSNWSFGKHFIYLGIAYGLKFNVLLILPFLFVLPLIKTGKIEIRSEWKSALLSIFYTITGIVFAIPCLILSPIKPIFLRTYLHETFGGTVKGYDDASVNIISWMETGLGGNYIGLAYLSYVFIGLVLWLLLNKIRKFYEDKDIATILLLACGFVLTIVIMLKTKRLWPHYLWTGYILMLLGLLSGISFDFKSIQSKITSIVLVLMIFSSLCFFTFRELPSYFGLSKTEDIKRNTEWSWQSIHYIKEMHKGKRIATDGTVMYPFADFVATDIYHPFSGNKPAEAETSFNWYVDFPEKIWEKPNDIVVFYKRHPERMMLEHPNVYTGRHEELYSLFKEKLATDFVRDTAFGEIVIYKRK